MIRLSTQLSSPNRIFNLHFLIYDNNLLQEDVINFAPFPYKKKKKKRKRKKENGHSRTTKDILNPYQEPPTPSYTANVTSFVSSFLRLRRPYYLRIVIIGDPFYAGDPSLQGFHLKFTAWSFFISDVPPKKREKSERRRRRKDSVILRLVIPGITRLFSVGRGILLEAVMLVFLQSILPRYYVVTCKELRRIKDRVTELPLYHREL